MTQPLQIAYAACRETARREAKNFYYAFLALPKAKSDAMCAIYAFMRKADDIADDESLTIESRRHAMQLWMNDWHATREGKATRDPVFVALADVQEKFSISDELLLQLVRGTTMDIEPQPEGVVERDTLCVTEQGTLHCRYQVYATFPDLARYCYLVASVVGLTCIRVFGYSDSRAEVLAEQTGLAFQMTNILRDIREDSERNRIYLPLEDMERLGVTLDEIPRTIRGLAPTQPMQELLDLQISRAREYYRSADELIPLIHRDSRAAMEVLVSIYRGLLERIAKDPSLVFQERISVPTSRKMMTLAGGFARSIFYRASA